MCVSANLSVSLTLCVSGAKAGHTDTHEHTTLALNTYNRAHGHTDRQTFGLANLDIYTHTCTIAVS